MGQKPIEQLFSPTFRGPGMIDTPSTNPFAGRTTLNSGSTSVTISTAVVNSDSLIFLTSQIGSMSAVTSYVSMLGVNSIVSGVSFAVARANNQAMAWDDTVMWMIWKRS